MKKIFLIIIILFNFNFVYSQHTGSELMKFIKKIPSTETELDLYKKGMLNGIILGYKNGMQDGNTILKSMLKKNGLSLVPHS